MRTNTILLIVIVLFLAILIHLAVMKPGHKHDDGGSNRLPTNINYVLQEDPWGWYPKHRRGTFSDRYEHFQRHRKYL